MKTKGKIDLLSKNLVKGIIFIFILGLLILTSFYIFLRVEEYKAFEETKNEVQSWGLPANTVLIKENFQRVSLGTYCVVGIDLTVDSELSQEMIEEFYFERTSIYPQEHSSITLVEATQKDISRYEVYFEMNVYNTWECV